MNNNLVKHIIGIFFAFLLVFSTNLQGIAGYIDYQLKLEQKNLDSSNESANLFSQTSTEEENNQKNSSSNEVTEKIHYFHQINLFSFYNAQQKALLEFYHLDNYSSTNGGVMTPPPEFI